MKKDWHIIVFVIIHLLCFPLIYAIIYSDLNGYLFFLLIWMILNIPSLLIVFALLTYEYIKDKEVPESIYHLSSTLLTSILFLFFLNSESDPKNIYTIFQENQFMIIFLGIISHLIAFSSIELIKKLTKPKHAS